VSLGELRPARRVGSLAGTGATVRAMRLFLHGFPR
jgi:hypothetical protein